MPWIHRTGKHSAWEAVFSGLRLAARAPCTAFERDAGINSVVYFFVGYPAYPKGGVALLFAPLFSAPGSFTPFDSGALERGHLKKTHTALTPPERAELFNQFFGTIAGLKEFLGPFLAAHFLEPMDYVRREQLSLPDHPAYHGLVDGNQDRRAWTIEAQVHEDVLLSTRRPLRILFDNPAFLDELEHLAPEYLGCSSVKAVDADFSVAISAEAERLMRGTP